MLIILPIIRHNDGGMCRAGFRAMHYPQTQKQKRSDALEN